MNSTLFSELRTRAQEGIRDRMFKQAGESDEQLRELGARIAKKCNAIPLFGSIKDKEGAERKVKREYGGDWYELKDVVRMTIVVRDEHAAQQVRAEIISFCQARNGLGLLKNGVTSAENDPCGYSGYNFVVRLKNGRPGEIQINTPEILYAKMKPASFRRVLGDQEYTRIKSKYHLEGGLGHALYEIHRIMPNSPTGQITAQLSKQYYAYFRGMPQAKLVWPLREQINRVRLMFGIHVA